MSTLQKVTDSFISKAQHPAGYLPRSDSESYTKRKDGQRAVNREVFNGGGGCDSCSRGKDFKVPSSVFPPFTGQGTEPTPY